MVPSVKATTLGAFLREKRNVLGLSQANISEKAGLSETYYGKIEMGQRNPSTETLHRICDALDLNEAERESAFSLLNRQQFSQAAKRLPERLRSQFLISAESRAPYSMLSPSLHLQQIQRRIERLFHRTKGRGGEWTALERLLDIFEPPDNLEVEERESYWKALRGEKRP